ncbi:hypothetical protein CB0940_06122 [Cercospora beticola]|uniref:Uncharacterized protein n=1 Tax=Cercospora beticola TaxID=122368 RepID=A0A2G5HYQ7_CERBT|nr:hypothetical protein CB0940_06122 [Cercospora beticola]PIA97413.1 hypothetical protein CB0940_06122 [Cercospora beticola]WPA98736.1 hypothetical protein RHO25_003349 [Cercospora beticola]
MDIEGVEGAIIGCELPPTLLAARNAGNKSSSFNPNELAQDEVKGTCFYDLPPELRNYIYELAMVDKLQTNFIVAPLTPVHNQFQEPKLLQASKQVRTEAGAMFYRSNKFFINIDSHGYSIKSYMGHALRWIRMICHFNGEQAFNDLHMCFAFDCDSTSGQVAELMGLKYMTGLRIGFLSRLRQKQDVKALKDQGGGMFVSCNKWSMKKILFARQMMEAAAEARHAGWSLVELSEEYQKHTSQSHQPKAARFFEEPGEVYFPITR